MISKEEVQKVAKLARLKIGEKEEQKLQKELSSILEYINKLKEVNIEGVEPTSHSVPIKNVTRLDRAEEPNPETRKRMIEQAPEIQGEYIKVKSIL